MKDLAQGGQLLGNHVVDAGVLQSHAVEHAVRAFGDAGQWVAEARLPGGALEAQGAQDVDVIVGGKLLAKAEGAAGGNHRVIQLHAAQGYGGAHHTISSLFSTGPSLQMRLVPYLVLQLQPMQAPKPQAMRASKLYWPGLSVAWYRALSMGSGPQA